MKFDEVLSSLQDAQGDPHALTIATARVVCSAHDSSLFEVLEIAAVPHWFDEKVLAALLHTDDTTAKKLDGQTAKTPNG